MYGHDGLTVLFTAWVIGCILFGAWAIRRAPAVALALVGAVVGAVVAFLARSSHVEAGVPVATAWGASVGVAANGLAGLFVTSTAATPRHLRRAAAVVLVMTPIATALFTWALRSTCPLYWHGKGSGYCNYRKQDLLGGWSSEVLALFFLDGVFLGVMLLIAARRARREEEVIPSPRAP